MAEYVLTIGLVNHVTHQILIKGGRPETCFRVKDGAVQVALSNGAVSFSLAQIATVSFIGRVVPLNDKVPSEVSEAERIIAAHKKAAE